jgi:hypothetical protein
MKLAICVVLSVIIAVSSVSGEEERQPIKFYNSEREWIREQSESDLAGARVSLVLFTNRFCPLTNLIELARETHTDEFRDLVTSAAMANGNKVRHPQYKLFATSPDHCVTLTFLISTNGLTANSSEAFERRVRHYVQLRKDGMSRAYSLASLRAYKEEIGKPKSKWGEYPAELSNEEIKRRFWIPDQWIAESYSTKTTVFVIDTNFAWKFHQNSPTKRYDTKEFDAKLGPIIAAAQVEAMKEAAPRDSIPDMWKAAQQSLRVRHGIDWASPADLNSGPLFNLVYTNRWWLTNR